MWDVFFVEGHDVSMTSLIIYTLADCPGAIPYRHIHTKDERGFDHSLRNRLGSLHLHVDYDFTLVDSRQAHRSQYCPRVLSSSVCRLT